MKIKHIDLKILYLITFTILISPFIKLPISMGEFEVRLWQIVPLVLMLFFIQRILFFKDSEVFYYLFLCYILINSLISISLCSEPESIIRRLLLFLASYSLVFIILNRTSYYFLEKDRLRQYLILIVCLVCFYGIYQFIGRIYSLPFTFNNVLRFRVYQPPGIYQISSFFEEPAFFCQFLITCLYIFLFIYDAKDKFIIFIILINIILTISLGGYIASLILVLMKLTEFKMKKVKGVIVPIYPFKRNFTMIIIVLPLIFLLIRSPMGLVVLSRAQTELFQGQTALSGGVRVYGEIEHFQRTLRQSPLLGYGIGYNKEALNRTMGLNAITEVMVRWGLLGVIFFAYVLIYEKIRFKSKNIIGYTIFLLLFFAIDGAIAKPVFWLCLSLVILFERIEFMSKTKVLHSRIVEI